MNTAKIVTIICWLVTALILIALVIWLVIGSLLGLGIKPRLPVFHISSFKDLKGPLSQAGSYTVVTDGIDSINVEWTAGEISITPYDGSDIKITEYSRRQLNDREKLVYNVTGGTLSIRYAGNNSTFNMPAKKLDLFVPEAVAGSLSSLYVQSTSADLAVSGFSAEALEIHETSGTTELSDIRGDLTSIHSTSGKISISGLEASRLSMSSVSGDITLWDAAADAVTSGTTSGSQHLEGKFNTLELSSVSGEIGVVSAENPDSIQGKTVSGGICVTIPGKDNLEVSSSTVSGRFTTEVPVINAGGTPAYHFSSVSGNINILKYKG